MVLQVMLFFGKYDMFSHYAVIWWDRGQASIIRMDGLYVPGGMLLSSSGTDQNGRKWQLSDDDMIFGSCY